VGGTRDKAYPEDADARPLRFLLLILGGILFEGMIELSQGGLVGKAMRVY